MIADSHAPGRATFDIAPGLRKIADRMRSVLAATLELPLDDKRAPE